MPSRHQSVALAKRCLESSKKYNWNLELFEGVDGETVKEDTQWEKWNIKINQQNAKCRSVMSRPGVRGCFLSHWSLWNKCIELNEPVGIFEHDVEFLKQEPDQLDFDDILKLDGFVEHSPRPAGIWWAGAMAYILKPTGAIKLVEWAKQNGALPADVAIGADVLNVQFDREQRVRYSIDEISFTRDTEWIN
jgi:GR25 family glycosyltransferase involved in LPS biosynthesis